MPYLGAGAALADPWIGEPEWPVLRRTIGPLGTRSVLKEMARITREECLAPDVRHVAYQLAARCPQDDAAAIVGAVRRELQPYWFYVRDPRPFEFLQAPKVSAFRMRRFGRAYGDCDDLSMIQAACMTALGIPARFAAIATRKARGHYNHVRAEGKVGGRWITTDFLMSPTVPQVRQPLTQEV